MTPSRYPDLHVLTREKACVYQRTRSCLPCVTQLMRDGCVHLLYNCSWKFLQRAAGKLLSEQPVLYGKVREYGTSMTYKSHQPGHSPPASQAGSHLAYRIIGYDNMTPQPASSPSQGLRIWILGWTLDSRVSRRGEICFTYLSQFFSCIKCY